MAPDGGWGLWGHPECYTYLMGYALCRWPLPIAYCFKIVVSLHFCKQILDSWGPNCHLTCLLPPLWRPGGPWDDPGASGSTRNDTLRSRLKLLLIFGGFRDPILKACWAPWTNKCVFCSACFQASFSDDFWLCIWVSGIGERSIWHEMYCKNQLSQKLDLS